MRGFRERAGENRDSLISEPFMELSRRRVLIRPVRLTACGRASADDNGPGVERFAGRACSYRGVGYAGAVQWRVGGQVLTILARGWSVSQAEPAPTKGVGYADAAHCVWAGKC